MGATPAAADSPSAVHVVKGPYLTQLTESGVDVRFELDAPGVATVDVTRDGDAKAPPPRSFGGEARTPSAMQLVSLAGLDPLTHYTYDLRLGGQTVGKGSFTTAPKLDSGAPLKFIVYGDDRTNPDVHRAIVRAIKDTPSDFLVNTGDMVADGASAADWQSFFDIEAPLLRDHALFACIGNHELYDDAAGANFSRYLGFVDATGTRQPYGTARLSDTRFFFLNAMHDWSAGPERQWLERELGRADTETGLRWRIAVVHHSPWSSGPHGPNTKFVAAHIPELLSAHKVDLILGGHDHIYERGEGTGGLKYMLSGGGGAPLYRVEHEVPATAKAESSYHFIEFATSADAIRTVARRVDGSIVEKCALRSLQPWDCDSPVKASSPTAGPTSPSPVAPEAKMSRCGCSLPGARAASTTANVVLGSMAGALALVRRRRRRRSRQH